MLPLAILMIGGALTSCSDGYSYPDWLVCVFHKKSGELVKVIAPSSGEQDLPNDTFGVPIPISQRFGNASNTSKRDPGYPVYLIGKDATFKDLVSEGEVLFYFNVDKACEFAEKHLLRNIPEHIRNDDTYFDKAGFNIDTVAEARDYIGEAEAAGKTDEQIRLGVAWAKWLAQNQARDMITVVDQLLRTYAWEYYEFEFPINADRDGQLECLETVTRTVSEQTDEPTIEIPTPPSTAAPSTDGEGEDPSEVDTDTGEDSEETEQAEVTTSTAQSPTTIVEIDEAPDDIVTSTSTNTEPVTVEECVEYEASDGIAKIELAKEVSTELTTVFSGNIDGQFFCGNLNLYTGDDKGENTTPKAEGDCAPIKFNFLSISLADTTENNELIKERRTQINLVEGAANNRRLAVATAEAGEAERLLKLAEAEKDRALKQVELDDLLAERQQQVDYENELAEQIATSGVDPAVAEAERKAAIAQVEKDAEIDAIMRYCDRAEAIGDECARLLSVVVNKNPYPETNIYGGIPVGTVPN